MKKSIVLLTAWCLYFVIVNGQKLPGGNPADYKELQRFQYQLTRTNYRKLESQMRAVPIGEGFLDYKNFINTLKEIGYQGYIAYEMCEVLDGGGSIENLDNCAKKFIEYMKQFRQAGYAKNSILTCLI